MQFSVAVIAAIAGTAIAAPGYPVSSPAPASETPCSEEAYSTYPAATSYPQTYPVSTPAASTYPAQSYPVSSVPAASTYPAQSYPVSSVPAASTYPAQSYPVSSVPAASTYPAQSYPVSSPAASTYAVVPAPSISVQTIATCVPTTVYKTWTVPAASGTPAPYPTGPAPNGGAPGAPSGSGVGSPYPTSSPITPATGAGSSVASSMMGVAAAVAAAFFLA